MSEKLVNPELEQTLTAQSDATESDSSSESRRRFIKKAIATAPIILTVTSRPVWAANCSLSGQLSGNLSEPDDCYGEGCSFLFYKANKSCPPWHYTYPPQLSFSEVFGVDYPRWTSKSMGEIIDRANPLKKAHFCALQAIAALQNSATPTKFPYKVDDLILDVNIAWSNKNYEFFVQLADLNQQSCPYQSF